MAGTRLTVIYFLRMAEEAERFRRRAADCRQIALDVRDRRDADLLRDIADELDAEADKIDRREGGLL